MAQHSDYVAQLTEACRLVAEAVGLTRWELAYQSRSGSPAQPWLEPDILDRLRAIRSEGITDAVVMPIGFLSDHVEVLYDLDVEARALATEIGLSYIRAATVGTHPAYIRMIRDLIIERMTESPERPYLGTRGPNHDFCYAECCLRG
jgi:ferrochelatase